jgi:isochorismate synthase
MNTLVSEKNSPLTEIDCLSRIITHAVEQNFSVALWKLPNNPVRHLVLSRETQLLKKGDVIEELKTGFIFSPFDQQKERLFVEADFSFSFTSDGLKSPENPLEITSSEWLKNLVASSSGIKSKTKFYRQSVIDEQGDKQTYINLVSKGVEEIQKGSMEKIVLSRTQSIQLSDEVDVVNVFEELCNTYSTALVSFVSSPEAGTWLGASPEILVGINDNTIFKTVALAGTKTFQGDINLKTVAWTQKEIEEQALVERYIISCFKKIRLREYDEHGPKTVVAGNLLHLKSEFTVDMKATNFPQLGSVMLQLLHPTSAVCGMPLEPSLKFLKENEGYDRQYYAGYLGPVNFSNQTNLFVNLRCMQLHDQSALLYAGAGITIDSDPEEEWHETEMKLNTIRKVIHQQQ